jgi:hypothetical protein
MVGRRAGAEWARRPRPHAAREVQSTEGALLSGELKRGAVVTQPSLSSNRRGPPELPLRSRASPPSLSQALRSRRPRGESPHGKRRPSRPRAPISLRSAIVFQPTHRRLFARDQSTPLLGRSSPSTLRQLQWSHPMEARSGLRQHRSGSSDRAFGEVDRVREGGVGDVASCESCRAAPCGVRRSGAIFRRD